MFACFTPVAWPAAAGKVADPSGRICIVSLVNKQNRPFRLKLKANHKSNALSKANESFPCFGREDVSVMESGKRDSCEPNSFELDTEAESKV